MAVRNRPRSKRERVTGRGEGKSHFGQIPTMVGTSKAATSLPPSARWLLVAIAADYNGFNNGALTITRRRAAEWGVCNDSLRRGLPQLEERGLIVRTDTGSRSPPRPARFAITWKPVDQTNFTSKTVTPTGEWKSWPNLDEKIDSEVRRSDYVRSVDQTRDAA